MPNNTSLRRAPASVVQKGLHFIQKIQPESCAYNLVLSARIIDVDNVAALVASIESVINSESALRATFSTPNDELSLVYDPQRLNRVHLGRTPDSDPASLQIIAREKSRHSFDLETDTGIRVDLVQYGPREHLLVMVAHHAVLDFWSLAVLLQRIGQRYGERLTAQAAEASLSGVNVDYLDDLGRMAEARQDVEPVQAARDFWQATLPQAPDALAFATDFPRPANYRYRGDAISFAYSPEQTSAIKAWCRENRVTPYQFFVTVFELCLHRLTGQPKVLVATPIAGRHRRQLRSIGNYVTSILMVNEFGPDTCFDQALARTREHHQAAMRHSHYSLPEIVAQVVRDRDTSRPPLVQAAFSWDKVPGMEPVQSLFVEQASPAPVTCGALTLAPCYTHQQLGQFEWALEMGSEIDDAWYGVLKYSDDLYRRETARQLSDLVRATALSIVDAQPVPAHLLSQISAPVHVSSPANRIDGATVLSMFDHQVRQGAARPAVADAVDCLSYEQVAILADAVRLNLQPHLRAGATRIGVSVRKNRWVVPLLLGVMRAGAAYVPIDPAFPDARRALIEDRADLAALITDDPAITAASADCATLQLDSLLTLPADGSEPEPVSVAPADSAYILFTSGSTGTPKGVEISHAALANFLRAMEQRPGLRQEDVLLSITTISFDISILELFGPLVCGGQVVIADMDTVRNATELEAFYRRIQPSVMQATPASWKMLIQAGWEGDPGLKLLCGGEPLPRSLAEDLLQRCGELWNMYGPTETTIWSSCQKIESDQPICLGTPLINTPLYVLDDKLQQVPKGAIGELFIGGAGLSKGYFRAPELTARAFVDNPFAVGLIYRTGDLVRLDSLGNLHYVARKDDQIKLNGYRIELGDINEHILRLDVIDDAVTVLRTSGNSNCLVSYYVGRKASATGDIEAAIRRQLKTQLPAYMVPSVLVRLESLPYTANRKVDKKQLPDPLAATRDRAQVIEPRDTCELALLTIFRDVLEAEAISVDDDFFAMGGNSVSAVTVVARINRHFGVDYPADFVLRNASIESLAAALREQNSNPVDPVLVPMHRNAGKPRLFLIHPIGGTLYCYLKLNQCIRDSYEIYGLQSPGLNDGEQSLVSVEDMADLFSDRIQSSAGAEPVYLAGWCFGGVLCYELSEQLRRKGVTVARTIMFDSRAPIAANHPENGDDAMLLSWFARDLAVPQGKSLHIEPDSLRALDEDDMFGSLFAQLVTAGVLPPDSKVQAIRHLFEVYLANAIALQMYLPGRYDNDYLLLKARDEAPDWGDSLGWDQVLGAAPAMELVAGDHNSMMFDPQVAEIGRILNALPKRGPLTTPADADTVSDEDTVIDLKQADVRRVA